MLPTRSATDLEALARGAPRFGGRPALASFGAAAGYELNQLTLSFVDPRVEARFTGEHLVRSLPVIRTFLFAAALLYAGFGILDPYIVPEAREAAWLIRYAAVCPILLGIVALSFTRLFAPIAQVALSAAMLASGLGIVAMTALAAAPGNGLYYAGLIMVVIYGSSLIRLRCIYAAIISLALVLLYQAVAIWLNPIPRYLLLSNDFHLGMSVAMGVFSAYVQEFFLRRDFVSNELIRRETEISDRLRVAAEAASRAKSDFFTVIGKELRTPLDGIIGCADAMRKGSYGPLGVERYEGYAADIHNAANRLLGMINDILDLSMAETGLALREDCLDLVAMVRKCIRPLSGRAAEAGVRICFTPAVEQEAWIRGDGGLIEKAFVAILTNAVRFTPAGGRIGITLETGAYGGRSVRFTDTGVGIAEAQLSRVFEPFGDPEGGPARDPAGNGLGLPRVRRIMDLHGGTVAISSATGKGTSVVVNFPAVRNLDAPRAAAASRASVHGAAVHRPASPVAAA